MCQTVEDQGEIEGRSVSARYDILEIERHFFLTLHIENTKNGYELMLTEPKGSRSVKQHVSAKGRKEQRMALFQTMR